MNEKLNKKRANSSLIQSMATHIDRVAQWKRTVILANRWLSSVRDKLRDHPYPGREGYEEYLRRYWGEAANRVDVQRKIHLICSAGRQMHYRGGGHPFNFAVAVKTTARLLKGDLALVITTNGFNERHPIWCSTSKGRRLVGCYQHMDLYSHRERAPMYMLEHQKIFELPIDDADLCDYLLGLRLDELLS